LTGWSEPIGFALLAARFRTSFVPNMQPAFTGASKSEFVELKGASSLGHASLLHVRHRPPLKRLQIHLELIAFGCIQSETHELVVVVDHRSECGEATIVVEAAFLMRP